MKIKENKSKSIGLCVKMSYPRHLKKSNQGFVCSIISYTFRVSIMFSLNKLRIVGAIHCFEMPQILKTEFNKLLII